MAWVISRSVVAIAFFIPVCAWVRLGTTTLAFFSGTTPVIHFSSISRHPPSLSTFKQPGVKKLVANVLLSTCRYICQGFQLDEEDTCVCHITFIAPLRITAVYIGPVFSVVTNNRPASAFLVSHVAISLEWCLSSRTIGVNDVTVACITYIAFPLHAARFRINDLEYNVNSWPEIGAINLPDACESFFMTFVYRWYSQTSCLCHQGQPHQEDLFYHCCKATWLSRARRWKRGRKLFCFGQYKVLAETMDLKLSMALEWSLAFGCSVALGWSVVLEWSLASGWSVDLGWSLAFE